MDCSKYTSSILTNYLILAGSIILGIVLLVIAEIFLIKTFVKQNAEQGDSRILIFNNKGSIIDFIGIIIATVILLLILIWSQNILAIVKKIEGELP